MLTTSANSTMSIISNASSQRYIPELPPRNKGMGGDIKSGWTYKTRMMNTSTAEIDSQNPPGAVGGQLPSVSFQNGKPKDQNKPEKEKHHPRYLKHPRGATTHRYENTQQQHAAGVTFKHPSAPSESGDNNNVECFI